MIDSCCFTSVVRMRRHNPYAPLAVVFGGAQFFVGGLQPALNLHRNAEEPSEAGDGQQPYRPEEGGMEASVDDCFPGFCDAHPPSLESDVSFELSAEAASFRPLRFTGRQGGGFGNGAAAAANVVGLNESLASTIDSSATSDVPSAGQSDSVVGEGGDLLLCPPTTTTTTAPGSPPSARPSPVGRRVFRCDSAGIATPVALCPPPAPAPAVVVQATPRITTCLALPRPRPAPCQRWALVCFAHRLEWYLLPDAFMASAAALQASMDAGEAVVLVEGDRGIDAGVLQTVVEHQPVGRGDPSDAASAQFRVTASTDPGVVGLSVSHRRPFADPEPETHQQPQHQPRGEEREPRSLERHPLLAVGGDASLFEMSAAETTGFPLPCVPPLPAPLPTTEPMSRVVRLASRDERLKLERLRASSASTLAIIRNGALGFQRQLTDVTFLSVEWQYDQQKLTVYYEAPTKVRFLSFAKWLHHMFHCRVWMHQLNYDVANDATTAKTSKATPVPAKVTLVPALCSTNVVPVSESPGVPVSGSSGKKKMKPRREWRQRRRQHNTPRKG